MLLMILKIELRCVVYFYILCETYHKMYNNIVTLYHHTLYKMNKTNNYILLISSM